MRRRGAAAGRPGRGRLRTSARTTCRSWTGRTSTCSSWPCTASSARMGSFSRSSRIAAWSTRAAVPRPAGWRSTRWPASGSLPAPGVSVPAVVEFGPGDDPAELEQTVAGAGRALRGQADPAGQQRRRARGQEPRRGGRGRPARCATNSAIAWSNRSSGTRGHGRRPRTDRSLPIIEIRSKTGFYDYQAKYVDDRTEYLFDTIEDAERAGPDRRGRRWPVSTRWAAATSPAWISS